MAEPVGDEREGLRLIAAAKEDPGMWDGELEAWVNANLETVLLRVGQLTQELGTLEAERTDLRHSILLVINATHESEMSDKVKGQLRRMLALTNREDVS